MKTEKELKRIGKYITLLLRHKPEVEHLDMDKNGYVPTKQLISRLKITLSDLDLIVESDNKTRFSYSTSKDKIRCNQGHSIDVDVELTETKPPDVLYHGTNWKSVSSILETGIDKRGRLHVHLSSDWKTADNVGKRHGSPYVIEINTKKMREDGIIFYLSENGVWLTEFIDTKYFKK